MIRIQGFLTGGNHGSGGQLRSVFRWLLMSDLHWLLGSITAKKVASRVICIAARMESSARDKARTMPQRRPKMQPMHHVKNQ